MNVKQAIALAMGTIAAIILVSLPRSHTPPRLVSTQKQPDGQIVTTYQAHLVPWQPVVFAVVIVVTGVAVVRLRTVHD